MTLTWAIYAVVVSLVLGWAGVALERVLRMYERQARFAWIAAMLGSMVIPFTALLGLVSSGLAPPTAGLPGWAESAAPAIVEAARGAAAAGGSLFDWAEWGFFAVWGTGTVLVGAWVFWSAADLRRRKPEWSSLPVQGGSVYRDEDLGPAAVGVLRPEVVVPGWVMELGDGDRRMVLLHEREHVRTGDPALIAFGWVLVALTPWNLPLWWHFRRLRQAVELDCDLRVVRRVRDRKRYGRVLLEAARMSAKRGAPLAAGGGSFVGDRIRTLMEGAPSFRPVRAATGLAVVLSAGLLAATLPSPRATPALTATALFQRAVGSGEPISRKNPRVLNEAEVARALRDRRPDDLRAPGVGGTARVLVHVRADGTVDETAVVESSGHPRLDRVAREVARTMRYEPHSGPGDGSFWLVRAFRFREG